MEDAVRTFAFVSAAILFAVVLPALLFNYWARKKAAWRKEINVVWRRHETEAERRPPACSETRRERVTR